jgi:hypothetical protein
VSTCGRFAAIVNDYGRHGVVVNLDRHGKMTMGLDGGSYHSNTVPFSVTFAEHAGRAVVVHPTGWNRLDISDAQTGRLLTARTHVPAAAGERPEHLLDYFHGRLQVSADGRWLADDGSVWHPAGMPAVWDLNRWLTQNSWESEDGPSRRRLCQRAYYWDKPMCFVVNDLLAIAGIGDDEQAILSGVRLFSTSTGLQVNAFAGPAGELFSDGRRLYSADPDGLRIWDPATGHHTGTVAGFNPTRHHPRTNELAMIDEAALHHWRPRTDDTSSPE